METNGGRDSYKTKPKLYREGCVAEFHCIITWRRNRHPPRYLYPIPNPYPSQDLYLALGKYPISKWHLRQILHLVQKQSLAHLKGNSFHAINDCKSILSGELVIPSSSSSTSSNQRKSPTGRSTMPAHSLSNHKNIGAGLNPSLMNQQGIVSKSS